MSNAHGFPQRNPIKVAQRIVGQVVPPPPPIYRIGATPPPLPFIPQATNAGVGLMAVLLKPRQLNVSAIKSKNGVLTIALATAVLTLLVSLFLGFGGFGPKWDQPFNASFDGNQYEVTFSDTFSRNDPYATGEGYHFFVARCYYANLGPRSRGLSWTDVDAELRTKTGHLYTSCGDDGSPYVEIIGSTVPLGFKFRIPNNEEPHSIILHKFGDKEIVIPTIKPPPAQKSRSSLTAAEIMRESQMRR